MPVLSASPRVLIATDVFGATPAVQALIRQLGIQAEVISAQLDGQNSFRNEQLAYQCFLANGGIADYAERVATRLQQQQFDFALGFSAGASALWLNSPQPAAAGLRQMTLFYGSRIREFRQLVPACPTRLIFAEQEAAFDPAELVQDLQQRGLHAELIKQSRHGFMNAYSGAYHVKLHSRFIDELSMLFAGLPAKAA